MIFTTFRLQVMIDILRVEYLYQYHYLNIQFHLESSFLVEMSPHSNHRFNKSKS